MTARASLGSLLPARENQRLPIRSAARAAFLLFAAVLVLLVGPAVPVHASLPTSRSSAFGRPALLEASAGLTPASLGASLNVAGDESATVELAHEAPRFSFAASLCLPALALAPLEPAVLELPAPSAAQSRSAPLAPPESSRLGHTIYGGWECRCERSYARNNPLKYVDPDGREPVKGQAGTAQDVVNIVRGIEANHPLFTPWMVLGAAADLFASNSPKGRYFYSAKEGWMDSRHVFAAARESSENGKLVTKLKGLGVELKQKIDGSASAFSYEDLPSNAVGATFGADVFNPVGAPLSEQLSKFLTSLTPQPPQSAPNYGLLPEGEAPRDQQSKAGRTDPASERPPAPCDRNDSTGSCK